jgi:hypothetical protein
MGLSDGAFFMIKHTPLPNGNHPISSPICPMGVADTLEPWHFICWEPNNCPVKLNQKMSFFRFEIDFFLGFQYQFGLEPEFWKAGFENLLLLLSIKKQ